MKILLLLLALACSPLHGKDESPIRIQVQEAHLGGVVKVRIRNDALQTIRIWQYNANSWGWGNWTFEFFRGNELTVFVRKPDEGFTVNIPFPLEIPSSGFIDQTFDLGDGTWVSHRIPIAPTYPSKEDVKNGIKGCFALLAIPPSEEAKAARVWTGTALSDFAKTAP